MAHVQDWWTKWFPRVAALLTLLVLLTMLAAVAWSIYAGGLNELHIPVLLIVLGALERMQGRKNTLDSLISQALQTMSGNGPRTKGRKSGRPGLPGPVAHERG